MILSNQYLRLFILATLVAAVGAGCTKEFKKERHLAAGDRYFQSEQYDKAEVEYLNVLKVAPLDPLALSRLGLIYSAEGKVGRAYVFLEKAVERAPDNLAVRVKFGQMLLSGRKVKEAREQALFILERQPGNEEALLLLADTTEKPADVPKTLQLVEEFRQKDKDSAGYHLAVANLRLRQNDQAQAEAEIKKALALDPKSSSAYASLLMLSLLRNDPQQAQSAIKTSAELAPLRSYRRLAYAESKLNSGALQEARQMMEDLSKKAPDYIPAYYLLAVMAAAENKHDDCAALIHKILARDPGNVETLLLNGRVLFAQNKLTNAISQFEQIISLYGKVPQAELGLSRCCLLNGDLVKAVNCLNLAIAGDPNLVDAILLLAEINTRKGESGAAIASLKTLIKQRPNVSQAYLLLAGAYVAQRNFDEAAAVLQQMTTVFPANPKVLYLQGMVFLQQSRQTDARRAFEKARELAPDSIAPLEQLVNLDLAHKEYTAAAARVTQQVARTPRSAEPWLLTAKIQLAQTNTAEAEAALMKAIELNPDLRVPYLLLTQIYISTHKQQQAIERLTGLVARHTNDVAALMQLGMLHGEMTNYAAARQTYEKLLTVNPRFSPALNNLAVLSFEQFGLLDKACDYARRARELLPDDPFAADTLGWLLYQKGDYAHALSLCQEAAAKMPDEPEIQFHLGMIFYMLDQPALALPPLQKALSSTKVFSQKDEGGRRLVVLAISPDKADPAALAKLEERLRTDPSDPVALGLLAAFYVRDGRFDQALNVYERALKVNPKNARVMEKMARLYEVHLHAPQKAIEMARDAHGLLPDDPQITHTLGRLAFQAGEYQWASSLLQETARKLPDDPEVTYDFAWSCYSLGRLADADSAMRRLVQSNPPFSKVAQVNQFLALTAAANSAAAAVKAASEAQRILSVTHDYVPALMVAAISQEKDKPGEAASLYEQVIAAYPLFSPAIKNLALLYASRLAQDAKAYPLAVKAHEALPQDSDVTRLLGFLAYRRGDYAHSARLLKEIASKRLTDAELLYYLGMAQYRLKLSNETKTTLQGALALNLPPTLAADARRVLAELK